MGTDSFGGWYLPVLLIHLGLLLGRSLRDSSRDPEAVTTFVVTTLATTCVRCAGATMSHYLEFQVRSPEVRRGRRPRKILVQRTGEILLILVVLWAHC